MVAVTAGPSATRPPAPRVPEYNINTPDTTVPTAPPPPLPLQPRPPVSIHLGRLLNTGGQSSIYECTVNPHPSDLPLSLIAKVVTRTSQAQADAAFVAAQMVQNIPPHPNIAPYFQVTMDSSQLSVTALMPRYPGDLQSYVGRRRPHPLPPPTIIAVALQITKAIAHLHRHGVVHGDISLRNVVVDDMLSATPTVHLIDLEECIRVAAGETVTLPDSRFTEEFAAPERRNGHVSHQTDVFSTGVLLYELATRQPSEFPGLVSVPELGVGMLNMPSMTPTRLSYVVHRDVGDTNLASLITLMLHHDAKTRVPMEHVEALLQTLATSGTLGFPTCLKPIRASRVPLDVAQSVVQIHHDALQFDVISLCVHCNQLRHSPSNPKYRSDCTQNRIHLPGQLSPSASQQPKALGAMSPPGSVSYFMYPMATSMVEPGFEVVETQGDPMKQLQLHGGFLAYHSDTHAVADLFVMSETSSGVLSRVSTSIVFSAAQPWPSECTVELQRQGRIHGPIPAFLGTETPGAAKAHQFAWLRPQEQFKLANGETWTPCEDGGFVFWFNENAMQPNPLDRMFAIAAPIGPVPAPPAPLLKSPRESPKLLASRAVNATLAAAGAAVQIASAATSVIFGRGDGSVSPPPIASARHDIVPVSLHGCSIALQLIEVGGQHFRVPSTGEEGDVGLANEISAAAAAVFKFPRQTVRIALLQVRHARGGRLLPHHGLLGVDIRGVPTGVLALRVVVDNPGVLRSVSTAAPAGFRIPTIVPREGQRTERYTGNTEPLPLMTQAEDEARNAQQQPRFFGMEVQRELIRFFYVVDDACTVWHVRNLRV